LEGLHAVSIKSLLTSEHALPVLSTCITIDVLYTHGGYTMVEMIQGSALPINKTSNECIGKHKVKLFEQWISEEIVSETH